MTEPAPIMVNKAFARQMKKQGLWDDKRYRVVQPMPGPSKREKK